jgi:AraC family transcriptional regulator of adaptative response / DNA-3-methyladenine glycosylase II
MLENLDPERCYQACLTKDRRFDGQFFIGVKTTGIYCRPVCPARMPKRENCVFFVSAAAAQEAGLRPCLRCCPELSPNLLMQVGTGVTVKRALRLIGEGALDDGSVEELAARVGVGDRHLRQLFAQHLGTSPVAVAQTRRVLFAKQLIDETMLPMTDVAMAAGYASLRRFNAVILGVYGRSPTDLRGAGKGSKPGVGMPMITLKLPFSEPYDWVGLMKFWAGRAMPGLEVVNERGYGRAIALNNLQGTVEVSPIAGQSALLARICFPEVALLGQIVERLRRMFDLGTNGAVIGAHLGRDPILAPLLERRPGVRIPGAWEPFELAVRAILGQQISVAAATTLAGRLVAKYGEPLIESELSSEGMEGLRFLFPRPEVLAEADLTEIGVTKPRARAIASLGRRVADDPLLFSRLGRLEEAIAQLCELPGIGEWTAQYIAMRALGEPDAFPGSDLGLLRGMAKLGKPVTKQELGVVAEAWRPWRSYAAMLLWMME